MSFDFDQTALDLRRYGQIVYSRFLSDFDDKQIRIIVYSYLDHYWIVEMREGRTQLVQKLGEV